MDYNPYTAMTAFTAKLPKGIYWIGDPTYTCDGSVWEQIYKAANGTCIIDGHLVAVAHTAYGDGIYCAVIDKNIERDVYVDSAQIALIPCQLVSKSKWATGAFRYGIQKEFTSDVEFSFSEGVYEIVSADYSISVDTSN